MIVPGIVLRNVGMWGANPRAQPPRPTAPSPVFVVETAPRSADTPAPGNVDGRTIDEPQHFIQIGGPATFVGTAVFSNPIVQDWVRENLGWNEQTDVQGNPIAY